MKNYCTRYNEYAREPLSERHVQAIWYDREFRPSRLLTRRGIPVKVIDPGEWNLTAGPDFKNAILEIGREGKRIKGDVEIHISPSDWTAHNHANDPLYKNIIAHVTWCCGPEPATLPPNAISIWLGRFVTSSISFSPDDIDLTAYPFARLPLPDRPCYELLKENPTLAQQNLSAAGTYRLKKKAKRLATLLQLQKPEQVFYEEVMCALGYKHNTNGFRRIAQAVPYKQLIAEKENASAALIASSEFINWNLCSVRPNNSPQKRLAAAAILFTETEIMTLLKAKDFSKKSLLLMLKLLTNNGLIGRKRAAAIISNVVVPFALALGNISDVPDWLPSEDISEPVTLTAFRMFGRDHNPAAFYAKNNLLIQGLIQIHRDFCLLVHPNCDDCDLLRENSLILSRK